jgi:uncharacterized protein YegL
VAKNSIEIVGILDRSGSMESLEKATIDGYNEFIKKQKAEGPGYVTLAIFDDQYDIVYEQLSLKKVPKLKKDVYYSRGMTALRDAVGRTITTVHERYKNGKRPDKTLVFIITDGYENASTEFTQEQIKKMIKKRTKDGWEFFFMGANVDSFAVGTDHGISKSHISNYAHSKKGTKDAYSSASVAALMSRRGSPIEDSESLSDLMDMEEEERDALVSTKKDSEDIES